MIAITGISGLVGGNMARALIAKGHSVRGLIHHDRQAVEGLDIQLSEGDISDIISLKHAFKGVEIVYHLAASISLSANNWPFMNANNVIGTRNVVEACLACGIQRLVHLSSIHAMEQEPLGSALDETRPLALSSKTPYYDRSKALGELEVQRGMEQGLDAVIINPTGILGPNDFKPSYFGKAVIALAKGKLPALVQGGFDWVDVRDVVDGIIAAAQHAPSGAKYLLSGHWRSITEIARLVAKETDTKPSGIIVPMWLAYLGLPVINIISIISDKEPLYTRFSLQTMNSNKQISHARATDELGYAPRSFEETLTDTIRWFDKNGYLDD
ncbi:MAG: NAD-dependent epimerase/dehydratase family protein [Chloroflexi bacterium]|nr:NAD-dependent epimerase/dehydratase family protein [Chloroflexota bacterium]